MSGSWFRNFIALWLAQGLQCSYLGPPEVAADSTRRGVVMKYTAGFWLNRVLVIGIARSLS